MIRKRRVHDFWLLFNAVAWAWLAGMFLLMDWRIATAGTITAVLQAVVLWLRLDKEPSR